MKVHTVLACSMMWHFPGNPARLIKEWGCVDLPKDTMHLKKSPRLSLDGNALL